VLQLDHVILGVGDVDRAGEELRQRYGLGSVAGGRHEAWGTGNRIVPLGSAYLEVMAVVDPAVARGTEFGRNLSAAVAGGDRFVGWSLRTDDLAAVAERLGLPMEEGGRVRPDGQTVRWRLAGRNAATPDAWLPFFIAWDIPPDAHPGRTETEHPAGPSGISWVEVAGDEARLKEWLGGADLPVRILDDEPWGVRAVGIATTDGEVVVRADATA
jgi:hypothetical protein